MSDTTCWYVSCYNYGRSTFFCEHSGDDDKPRGMRGSEAGCYE